MRQNLADHKNWVVVEIPSLVPHYYPSFDKALKSPVQGHLMTETYYRYHFVS
jgi:hypothetical protein